MFHHLQILLYRCYFLTIISSKKFKLLNFMLERLEIWKLKIKALKALRSPPGWQGHGYFRVFLGIRRQSRCVTLVSGVVPPYTTHCSAHSVFWLLSSLYFSHLRVHQENITLVGGPGRRVV